MRLYNMSYESTFYILFKKVLTGNKNTGKFYLSTKFIVFAALSESLLSFVHQSESQRLTALPDPYCSREAS